MLAHLELSGPSLPTANIVADEPKKTPEVLRLSDAHEIEKVLVANGKSPL